MNDTLIRPLALQYSKILFGVVILAVWPVWSFKAQAAPPGLVNSRWMTKAEDPTCLDFYPLFGRSAEAEIFVQADLSGAAPIEEGQVEFFLENAQLLPEGLTIDFDLEIIKGDENGATVQAVLEVPNFIRWENFTPGATLALKMRTFDSGGAQEVFNIGEVCLYGPKAIQPDVIPPGSVSEGEINGGEAVNIPMDLAEDEFTFPGEVRATDVGKGIQSVQMVYRSANGDFIFFEADMFDLSEGTLNDGLFTGTCFIGKYSESGIYDLFSVVAEDKYGNGFFLNAEQAPATIQKMVEVINPNADTEPPILTSPVLLDPDPATADVTEASAEIILNFSVADEGSGFSFGIIRGFHKTDPEADSVQAFLTPEPPFLTSGDASMGDYMVPLTVVPGTLAGDYNYQIQLFDNAVRDRTYGPPIPESTFTPEPLPVDSEDTFTVVNETVPDMTPPELTSIACRIYNPDDPDNPAAHDFANGPGVMEITMMISEPDSGLAFGGFFGESSYVRVISPTGATDVRRTFGPPDLDFMTGAYTIEIPLQKAIEAGDYCVAVKLENSSGYQNFYGLNYDYFPFPGEFDGTCEVINSGVVDCAAPVPVNFSVEPTFILPGTDGTLTVTMRVTDGPADTQGTGLEFGSISLRNGILDSDGFRETLETINFLSPEEEETVTVEGTRQNATYTFEFPVTGADVVGDFLSFEISLSDCVGNSRIFDTSICNTDGGRYPLPYDEARVGAEQENRPPAITSNGGGATAGISVEENTINVTTVTAADSDLPGDTLTFSISGGADSALFSLDMNSGALTFVTAPAVDPPGDANGDNIYEVTVKVEDSEGEMDTQALSVSVTPQAFDESDYDAYASGENSPFPSSASPAEKAFDFDYDGDGETNGEEFIAGTDPSVNNNTFAVRIRYDGQTGTKVIFSPYTPATNSYSLYHVFEGPGNNERVDTGLVAQPFEGGADEGCFLLPPGATPETLLVAVGIFRTSL